MTLNFYLSNPPRLPGEPKGGGQIDSTTLTRFTPFIPPGPGRNLQISFRNFKKTGTFQENTYFTLFIPTYPPLIPQDKNKYFYSFFRNILNFPFWCDNL
jgi:hypothetical protein